MCPWKTTGSKVILRLWVGAPHGNLPPCDSGDKKKILANTFILPKLQISVTSYAGLRLPLLFSLKEMTCHMLHASRITT